MPEKKSFSQKLMEKSPIWGPIGMGISIITALLVILIIFWRIITETGTVPGADPTSFAHTARVIVDYFKQTGHFPPIDFTWYAGFEHMHTPPLINFILGFIYYLTNNIWVALRIFQPAGVGLFFLGMFYLMKKEGYPTLNAFLAAMVFAFMPTIFNTYGSYTKMVAIFFLPIAFYFTNQILTKVQIKYIAYLAIIECLIILAHPMTGIVFAIFLTGYSMLYAILDRQIITRRFLLVILGIGLGFVLSSQYIIPFFLEKVGRTAIPAEEATVPNLGLLRIYQDFKAQIGGAIFALLPLYVIWREKNAKLTALYLMGLLSAFIFFGYYFGFGFYFPFNLTYGYIWFFMTGFAFAYLLGLVVPWTKVKDIATYFLRVEAVICIAIFYLYSANFYIHFTQLVNYKNEQFPANFDLARALNEIPNPGRVFPSHYPFGMTNWILGIATDKPNVEGHYFGISRIGKYIALTADAIHNSYPQYVLYKLDNLNVRYFLANTVLMNMKNYKGTMVGQEVLEKLTQNGYKLVFKSKDNYNSQEMLDRYWLYYLDKPSTYIMPVDEKILGIGKYSPTLAAAVSPAKIKILESGSEYLDDYQIEFLKNFETVILYGFSYRDKAKAEEIAREYVAQGGNLVVELFNAGISPLADTPNFLGVTSYRQKITQSTNLEILGDQPIGQMIPKSFDIPGEIYDPGTGTLEYRQLTEWNSLEYLGLDESLARLPDDENIFSIFGYKNINGGKVTFVGMNFFYHLYLSHNENELKFVKNLMKNPNISLNNSSEPKLIQKEWTPEKLKFEVSTDKERLLLISLAYSPHWHAYLNGQPIKVRNIEDLMVVQVPAGSSTLEMKYERTTVSKFAWLMTIITGIFLLGLIIFSKYFYKKMKNASQGAK